MRFFILQSISDRKFTSSQRFLVQRMAEGKTIDKAFRQSAVFLDPHPAIEPSPRQAAGDVLPVTAVLCSTGKDKKSAFQFARYRGSKKPSLAAHTLFVYNWFIH